MEEEAEKIVVKDFGPVERAEVEVKRMLILIGEQASGKSTLTKLIYFFRGLKDTIVEQYLRSGKEGLTAKEVLSQIKQRYLTYFGTHRHQKDGEVTYHYGGGVWVQIVVERSASVSVSISPELAAALCRDKVLRSLKDSYMGAKAHEKRMEGWMVREGLSDSEEFARDIYRTISRKFKDWTDSRLYVIAGRECTVSYQDAFSGFLTRALEADFKYKLRSKEQYSVTYSVDEVLMIEYLKHTEYIKNRFMRQGGFGGISESVARPYGIQDDTVSDMILKWSEEILNARYGGNDDGEVLQFEDGGFVYLKDASSGQKEVIRILQDCYLSSLKRDLVLRVVEEPEAHLFPEAQKSLLSILAALANQSPENQMLITTHSPYVLAVLNLFRYAALISDQHPEARSAVGQVVAPCLQLKMGDLAAYSLEKQPGRSVTHAVDLLDPRSGMIDQNRLDSISEEMSDALQRLNSLHAQYRRKQSHG